MLRKILYALPFLVGASIGAALAQPVNVVPQVGMITSILKNPTFSATSLAIVPASSATDIFCLNGSTSKTVHITRIWVTGTAGTLVTVPVLVNLNHSLDTGGTSYGAGTIQIPQINALNSVDVSTAAATAYSANPTIPDTSPARLHIGNVTLGTTAAATVVGPYNPVFGASVDEFDKAIDIPPAATVVKQVCLNLSSTTISSGVVNVTMEWTEQ